MTEDSRYLIYQLLRQQVRVRVHTGRRLEGKVDRVYRNVLDSKVELTIGGRRVALDEPDAILREGNDLVFVYGAVCRTEETDEDLFREAVLAGHSGESLHEMLVRTAPNKRRETRFSMKTEALQAIA